MILPSFKIFGVTFFSWKEKKRFMVLELSRQEITELLRQSCWLLLLHHERRWPPMYNIKWENFKQSPVSSDRQQGSQGSGGGGTTTSSQCHHVSSAYLFGKGLFAWCNCCPQGLLPQSVNQGCKDFICNSDQVEFPFKRSVAGVILEVMCWGHMKETWVPGAGWHFWHIWV